MFGVFLFVLETLDKISYPSDRDSSTFKSPFFVRAENVSRKRSTFVQRAGELSCLLVVKVERGWGWGWGAIHRSQEGKASFRP